MPSWQFAVRKRHDRTVFRPWMECFFDLATNLQSERARRHDVSLLVGPHPFRRGGVDHPAGGGCLRHRAGRQGLQRLQQLAAAADWFGADPKRRGRPVGDPRRADAAVAAAAAFAPHAGRRARGCCGGAVGDGEKHRRAGDLPARGDAGGAARQAAGGAIPHADVLRLAGRRHDDADRHVAQSHHLQRAPGAAGPALQDVRFLPGRLRRDAGGGRLPVGRLAADPDPPQRSEPRRPALPGRGLRRRGAPARRLTAHRQDGERA